MKILRASDYKRMPWKNGKGETAEIAVFPPHASVDDFDWRVSMASIVEDGAFSTFEKVDRTLIILDGDGITLNVEGCDPIELRSDCAPHSFPADKPTVAQLLGREVIDLNIMVRRGRASCHVTRQTAQTVQASAKGLTMVFALNPCTQSERAMLDCKDSVLLDPDELLPLDPDEAAEIIVIELW